MRGWLERAARNEQLEVNITFKIRNENLIVLMVAN